MRPFLRCALCPSSAAFTCASVALGTSSAPQAQFFPLSSRRATRSATAYRCAEIHPQRSRRPSLSLALALCFPSCRSPRVAIDTRRASASRASRSLTPRLARGTHEPAVLMLIIARAFFWFSFFSPLPLPGAAGFKKYGPAHQGRGIACAVLETRILGRVPGGTCRPAGAVPQAPSARRRREIFRGGAGGGRFGGQRGGQGRKMAVCAIN